jgi:DNA-binding NtrC family response regulator
MSDETTLRATAGPSPPLRASLLLRVIEGPDTGRELLIDDAQPHRFYVGRSPACDLLLSDPLVSRRHLAIEIIDGVVRASDVESTNGSTINGLTVGEVAIRGGETIRVGGTTLRVDPSGAAPPPLSLDQSFGRVLGTSREMRRLYPLCRKLAQSTVPVLIEGETGTGKEVLAESIHESGPRHDKPFVVFDCTSVAPTLLESELFGHERGAFTGATESRAGVFEQANGGTLLIDEIGDLDLSLQSKLLRAVERLEIRRVGGSKTIRIDVRILSATRRDLDKEVQAGRFRDDLFHRLTVARIELPPLRRRKGDLPLLVRTMIRQMEGVETAFTPELMARWDAYPWPGNVRELRNAVARRLALGELADVQTDAGPPSSPSAKSGRTPEAERAVGDAVDRILALNLAIADARQLVVDEFERRYLERVLAAHNGNVTRAAESSGIARRHFHRLMARMRAGS